MSEDLSKSQEVKYDSTKYYEQKGDFKQKNILITGSSGDIPQKLVTKLLNLNAKLFLIWSSKEKVDKYFGKEIREGSLKTKSFDFTSQQITVKDMKEIMLYFGGKLDKVIICHGRSDVSTIEASNTRDFDGSYAVNVRSTYNLITFCTPFLKLTKGCIVALSSEEAAVPELCGLLNTISKSMLNSLIQNAALELASFGVRVNGVAPGITKSELMLNEQFKNDPKAQEENLSKMGAYFPLDGKVIDSEDIIESILFLASDDAEFMTGEIITVDAGYALNHDMSFTEELEP